MLVGTSCCSLIQDGQDPAASSVLGTPVQEGFRAHVAACCCPLDHCPEGIFWSFPCRLHYRVSSGKIQFQRAFKDWEPGCRITCGGCSQVSAAMPWKLVGQQGLCLCTSSWLRNGAVGPFCTFLCDVCAAHVGCGHGPLSPEGMYPMSVGAAGCVTVLSLPTQDWGMEMLYRQVKLPILSIKNFVVETPAEKRRYKKWSSVTFPIKEFDYLEYCSNTYEQSF